MILKDQIALITGGSSGMGEACARYLQSQGMTTVVWDLHPNVLVGADLFVRCDVTQEAQVQEALQITMEQLGTPRVCVNCAGIAPAKRMFNKEQAMPLAEFKHVLEVNLIGTFNVMRLLAFELARLEIELHSQERGVIINTASVAAFEGQVGQTAYSASKGGIVSMTLPAARELARHQIRVNTIAPGLFETPLLLSMPEAVQEDLTKDLVFPKRLGYPEEFAHLVTHVIQNQMINGAVLRLDGALRMA